MTEGRPKDAIDKGVHRYKCNKLTHECRLQRFRYERWIFFVSVAKNEAPLPTKLRR